MEAIRIGQKLVIDIASDGTIYGIELLNANDQLRREDSDRLLVVNEATGEETELPLAVGGRPGRDAFLNAICPFFGDASAEPRSVGRACTLCCLMKVSAP